MTRKPAIDELLNSTPRLWKGRQFSQAQPTVPTGHARLDARLPGGGWPLGAVTELLCGNPGLGELSLLFPALAALGEQGQWVILIDPPWIPYPASLYAHGLCLERLMLARTGAEAGTLLLFGAGVVALALAWADLEGLRVRLEDGRELGTVDRMLATGANDVMIVRGERERLIPFVRGQYVKDVDLAGGTITVDWDPEF